LRLASITGRSSSAAAAFVADRVTFIRSVPVAP
jgi:hypothetical protein